jgi:hypothetical protein
VYYLTTKLENFYLNYSSTLSSCTLNNSFYLKDFAYTNNIVFIGYNDFTNGGSTPFNDRSKITSTFESYKIPSLCSQHFPFAFEQLPNPPYISKYINLNFRNVYPQSAPTFNFYNNLKFDFANTSLIDKHGFIPWSASSVDTRNAITLSVLNNGEIPVDIFGLNTALNSNNSTQINNIISLTSNTTNSNFLQPGEKLYIRGFDTELYNLSLTLPTNESFSRAQSGFTKANYLLKVENVVYYNSSGQTSGDSPSFQFDSTNTLPSGSLSGIPSYYVVSEYKDIIIPINVGSYNQPINYGIGTPPPPTYSINCSSTSFGVFNFDSVKTNVAVRGLLLTNSNTSFMRGYFVSLNNDIQLDCMSQTSVRIPFKDLA